MSDLDISDPKALGFDAARLARIDTWMDRNIETGRFAGSSVLIARRGEIAHLSATGQRSIALDELYEIDTITRIYSMTKMITSIAFMQLVERGLCHLDAPVSRFLPEFAECMALAEGANGADQVVPAPPPTLHQLLTHTSGLTYSFNPTLAGGIYATQGVDFGPATGGLEAACKKAAKAPLAFQPGSRWEYSIGIDIIGRAIEVITGKSLATVLSEEIFQPLGMVDTGFGVPESKIARYADCYALTEKNPLMPVDLAPDSEFFADRVETYSGGGGLVSTLHDYFRFGEMIRLGGSLDGHRVVSPRTLAFMRRNHLPGSIASMGPASFAEMPMDGMGFGIGGAMVLDPAIARTPGSVGDFGWGGMASTFFWTDPIEQLSCIFFTQLIPSSAYPNRAELKALVHAAMID